MAGVKSTNIIAFRMRLMASSCFQRIDTFLLRKEVSKVLKEKYDFLSQIMMHIPFMELRVIILLFECFLQPVLGLVYLKKFFNRFIDHSSALLRDGSVNHNALTTGRMVN